MKITKIFFPVVTVIRLEERGIEPSYFTQTPGGPIYPSEDVVMTEAGWRKALREAKEKNARVEVHEV